MKTLLSLLFAQLIFTMPLWAQAPTPRPSDDYIVVAVDLKHPQMVPFTSEITLLSAIVAGGDFNEFADRRFVYLVRSGKKQKIDLKPLRSDPSKDPKLEPWDIVYLPQVVF